MFNHSDPNDDTPYIQCLLKRLGEQQVAWIPKPFAVLGKSLRYRNDLGNWRDGWIVAEVYSERVGSRILRDEEFRRRMNKNSSLAKK